MVVCFAPSLWNYQAGVSGCQGGPLTQALPWNSCLCPPRSCLASHGWWQAGCQICMPIPGSGWGYLRGCLSSTVSLPFANMNSSGNLPTHHAERGQCLGCPCHSYSWLRLAEAAVSCQKERSGWGKYIGGPGKPHPLGSSARCICGSQSRGPTSSM